MTAEEIVNIAIQGLSDITNPIGRMKRLLSPGEKLNGGFAVRLATDYHYLVDIAKEVLEKINDNTQHPNSNYNPR